MVANVGTRHARRLSRAPAGRRRPMSPGPVRATTGFPPRSPHPVHSPAMTVELMPAPAPAEAAAPRPRIFSGIQPSGIVHLGNDLGAIRNYVMLQYEYEAIYCIVDYHALTSTHDAAISCADAHPGDGRGPARAGPGPGPLHAVRPEPPARAHGADVAAVPPSRR